MALGERSYHDERGLVKRVDSGVGVMSGKAAVLAEGRALKETDCCGRGAAGFDGFGFFRERHGL